MHFPDVCSDTCTMNPHQFAILAMAAVTAAASAQDPGTLGADSPSSQTQSPSVVTAPSESPTTQGVELPDGPRVAAGEDFRIPIHTGEADLGQPYGIWGVGGTYKVSFHNGATFIPYLGSAAPKNLPVRWTTQRVTAGSSVLMEAGEAPREVQDDYRYEYRFNAVTEAYDVHVEGLEQTFVIANRPATPGDLVVQGLIESPMTADNFSSAHRAIEFRGDDGVVYTKYSEAYVFDAAGSKANVLTSYQDGVVCLTVDGQFIADAQFPITIDPLQTRERVSGGTLRTSPDIARDDQANDVGVVFVRLASAPDRDAFCQVVDDCFTQGAAGGTIVWNDVNTWDTPRARVATLDSPQKYLIVVERRFPALADNDRVVRYHVHDTADLTLSTQYNIITPGPDTHDWRPDCGGATWSSLGDTGVIVFQRERTVVFGNTTTSEIWAVIVDVSAGSGANASHSAAFMIPGDANGTDQERPAVTRQAVASNTNPTTWVAAWQEFNGSFANDDWDAVARHVNDTGATSVDHWFSSAPNNGMHKLGLTIDGNAGRFLVGYSQLDIATAAKPTGVLGTSIEVERFDWPIGGSITKFDLNGLWANADRRWRVGDCAFDFDSDSFWAVPVISDRVSGPGSGTIYLHRIGYTGAQTELVTLHSFSTPTANQVGYEASAYYDDDSDLFQVAYAANADPTGLNSSLNAVYGNCYSYDTFTPWSTSGVSCSGATISWAGRGTSTVHDQQIGHEFLSVNVNGASSGSGHFILVALGTTNQPLIGNIFGLGCRLLVPANGANYLGLLPFQFGVNVSVDFPIPPFVNNTTLYFQDIHTNLLGNRFFSTQRLEVQLVK